MSTLRCLLLDLDGTLVDTAPDLAAATNRIMAQHGYPHIDPTNLKKHVTSGARGMVRAAAGHLGDDEIERLAKAMVENYGQRIAELSTLYPGMDDVLETVQSHNVRWGIVTNKFEHLARELVAALGLSQHCAVIVGGDTCRERKPSPQPIAHALKQLDVPAGQSLYVGDAQTDLEAATAAGCATAFAAWGYGPCGAEAAAAPGILNFESGHALNVWLQANLA